MSYKWVVDITCYVLFFAIVLVIFLSYYFLQLFGLTLFGLADELIDDFLLLIYF